MARRIPVPMKRRVPSRSPEFAISPMSPDDDTGSTILLSNSGEREFNRGAPEIGPHEIKKGKRVGNGSFAQVYAGMCRGLPVAVKVINSTPDHLDSEEGLRKFRDEIAVHQRLFHPNVVLLMGACTSGEKLMIVQELMHKDLERVLFDNDIKLSLARRVELGRQAALGMNWLHKLDPPVLHRDLKPSNCLLDRELRNLKIADFGLSAILPQRGPLKDSCGPRGTANYLAPEVLEGGAVTQAADVYAFGILSWQLLTRRRPYEDLGNISFDSFADWVSDESNRPEVTDEQTKDYPLFVDLIQRCWAADAVHRPSFEEVCEALGEALVEIAIPHDAEAQTFWIKFFPSAQGGSPHGVKVERVLRALLKWFRMPLSPELQSRQLATQLQYLETLLKERDDDDEEYSRGRPRITPEWFGAVINWFGPLDTDFFKRVGQLCSRPWFHGHLSSSRAARLLNGRAEGFFLVRFSGTEPGFFTISLVRAGKVTHVRIEHQPCSNRYQVVINKDHQRPAYRSLQELIEKEKDFLELTLPCPGSPFAPPQEEVSGYLGMSPIELEAN